MRFAPILRTALGLLLLLSLNTAGAQWPAKPVRFVVPFPAGGSTDVVGRILAEHLRQGLGQSFVIDNRAGAGGTTGSDAVAKAAPDGYTLLIGTSSTHAIASGLYGSKLPYDQERDFAPVTLIGSATILLVVHPAIAAKTVPELIALAKAKPGTLNFASSGNGGVSHLTGEYFKSLAGIQMQHVPYKGDTPMIADLVAGRVSLAFGTAVAFLPHVQRSALNALAVTNAKPSPVAPNLPTVAQTLPGFEALQWFGILMPAGTPRDIVSRLNAEIVKILRLPEVRERLQSMGIEVAGNTPGEFAAFMRDETAKWGRIVKESGAKID
ncbi:MAG: tripartite tricarboxylate transporter substrate binding protein [Betaproteobacteria bacterium]|nr:tripartite tricarboxylate transporter substrate binding protein [Betaproteobacteria bacterium]